MRFRLILKQAIIDFKSKLQLYGAFAIFLIVCLSLIIGMLSFANIFGSYYSNTFIKNGHMDNTQTTTFRFLDKNAKNHLNDFDTLNYNFLQDDGSFQTFVDETLENNPNVNNTYLWGDGFDHSQIKILDDMISGTTYDKDNLINVIGFNWGSVSDGTISYFRGVKGYSPKEDIYTYYSSGGEDRFNTDLKNTNDPKDLEYLALIKLNHITNAPLPNSDGDNLNDYWFYNSSLLNKFFIENNDTGLRKLSKTRDISYGTRAGSALSQSFYPTQDAVIKKSSLNYALMPGEDWMDKYSHVGPTPNEFRKNTMQGLYVTDRMNINDINFDDLSNMHYIYMDQAWMQYNGYKVGDEFTWDDNGEHSAQIIGTVVSKYGYWNRKTNGFIYLPIQFMNQLKPLNWTPDKSNPKSSSNDDTEPRYSVYANQGWIDSNYVVYDGQGAWDDFVGANEFMTGTVMKAFNVIGNKTIDDRPINFDRPYETNNRKLAKQTIFLFTLLAYLISLFVVILLVAVFWFIASESIKMQKKTLWFLKALGENKAKISLLTTISIMVPFIFGALLSIFGSLGVYAIMNSAVDTTYSFILPTWSFRVYGLIAFIILIVGAFSIFMLLNWIILSGNALSLHSGEHIGWITKLYMKTKGIYKHCPSSFKIGMSFIVQNIVKNIVTFVLLLIAFSVVLFAMQFETSARNAAHSYEDRYTPYQSLMLNKLNQTDSVQLNNGFINKTYGIKVEDIIKQIGQKPSQNLLDLLYSWGYKTEVVNSIKDKEQSIASQITGLQYVPIMTQIDNDNDGNIHSFHNAIYAPFYDLNSILNGNKVELLKLQKDAFFNKFLESDYIQKHLLNNDISSLDIAKNILSVPSSDVKTLLNSLRKYTINHEIALIGFLKYMGFSNNQIAVITTWIDHELKPDDVASKNIDLGTQYVENTITYLINSFAKQLDSARTLMKSVDSSLSVYKVKPNMSIWFNKSIIPKDTASYMATDLIYKGAKITGVGLDSRDTTTYNKVLKGYSDIKEIKPDEFNNSENMSNIKVDYTPKQNSGNNWQKPKPISKDVNVHVIHADISGKFASDWRISSGSTLSVQNPRIPSADGTIPQMYLKIDNVVKENTAFDEIYFNKVDYFNYMKQWIVNNWATDYQRQLTGKNLIPAPTSFGTQLQLIKLNRILNLIENNHDTRAMYALNNSVFSDSKLPYSLNNFTMESKIGIGYTFFSYLNIPVLSYTSQVYKQDFNNDVYIFSEVTKQIMHQVQPVISTIVRFIILLLILVFVVAVILITLVLLENRQTILLFKAMGYRLRSVNGYLLGGYIFADIFGLIAGILIGYFIVGVVSPLAVSMLGVSLYAVWSWQFIVTGIVMALVFVILILGAVTLFTSKQKPRDAFNTL